MTCMICNHAVCLQYCNSRGRFVIKKNLNPPDKKTMIAKIISNLKSIFRQWPLSPYLSLSCHDIYNVPCAQLAHSLKKFTPMRGFKFDNLSYTFMVPATGATHFVNSLFVFAGYFICCQKLVLVVIINILIVLQ